MTHEISLSKYFKVIFGTGIEYIDIEQFDNSKLKIDTDNNDILGTDKHYHLNYSAGLAFDSRDNEVAPSEGFYSEVSVRGTPGDMLDNGINYTGLAFINKVYVTFIEDLLTIATRLGGDIMFNDVPFYELPSAGGVHKSDFSGGIIRGIPSGRYAGKVKVFGNIETRSNWYNFRLGGQKASLGNVVFLDIGRIWSDFSPEEELDGKGIDLKYGIGSGLRFQWGTTFVMRFDFAYTPDIVEESPNFPVGVNVSIGHSY